MREKGTVLEIKNYINKTKRVLKLDPKNGDGRILLFEEAKETKELKEITKRHINIINLIGQEDY